MRRSGISVSAIQRIISAHRRKEREEYNKNLIASNNGDEKELPLNYDFENLDFNSETRIAKIVFLETKTYRTIERYVTQNYVKYPIYSDWKTKTKKINKTIKLTNAELENLTQNEDFLIRKFAHEIVINLNDEELFPSWFVLDFLKENYDETVADLNNTFENSKTEDELQINAIHIKKDENLNIIKIKEKQKQIFLKKIATIKKKISKIDKAKKSVFLSLMTLGIYNYRISKKRRNILCKKSQKYDNEVRCIQCEISQKEKDNNDLLFEKNAIQELMNNREKELHFLLSEEKKTYEMKLRQVKPLEIVYKHNRSFVLLKNIAGLEYEKIVGCYVIHNREKDKYYVGQSKDVLKRLKQHFKGTVPHNIIFAEDYYSSTFENKEDLFEVKIIPCKTKDELDKTEKDLIEEYDAWISGYNGTSGNS